MAGSSDGEMQGLGGVDMAVKSPGVGEGSKVSSKLESLPRDELIKFVKKQMLLLHKTKTKCDELTKELQDVKLAGREEASGDGPDDIKELKEEIATLTAAYNASQQSQEQAIVNIQDLESQLQLVKSGGTDVDGKLVSLTKHNKELLEEVECMQMKDTTLTSSLQCLQQELDKCSQSEKALAEQVAVLTEARDVALDSLKEFKSVQHASEDEMKMQLNAVKTEKSQLLEELESSRLSLEEWKAKGQTLIIEIEQLDQAQKQFETLKTEHDQYEHDLSRTREKLSQAVSVLKQLKSENSQLEEDLRNQQAVKQALVEKHKEENSELVEKHDEKNSEMREKMTKLEEDLTLYEKEKAGLSEELERVQCSLQQAQEEMGSESAQQEELLVAHQQLEEARAQHTKYSEEINEYVQATELLSKKLEEAESLCAQLKAETGGEDAETVTDLRAKLELVQSEYENVIQEKEVVKKQADLLESDKENLCSQLQASTERLNEWESMMQMLQEERDSMEAEISKLLQCEQSTVSDLDHLNSSLQEALSDRDNLRQDLCRMADEKGGITGRLSNLKQMVEEMNFERDELNERYNCLSDQLKIQKEDSEKMSEANTSLSSQIESYVSQSEEWKEKELTLIQEKGTLEDKIQTLNVTNIEIVSQLESKGGEASTIIQQLAESKGMIQNLEDENKRLLISNEEFKRERDISVSEEQKLRRQVDDLKQQIDSFAPERDMLENKLQEFSTMRRKFDATKDENQQLMQQIDALRGDAESMTNVEETIVSLQQEKAQLMEQLENVKSELFSEKEELKSQLEQLGEQHCEVKEENDAAIEELRKKMALSEEEMSSLREKCVQIQEELSLARTSSSQLETERQDLKDEVSNISAQKQSVIEISEENKRQLQEMEAKNGELESALENRNKDFEENCQKLNNIALEKDGLESEVTSLQAKQREVEENLQCSDIGEKDLQQQIERLEADNKLLTVEVSEKGEMLLKLRTETERDRETLQEECQCYKLKAEELMQSLESLKDGADSSTQKLIVVEKQMSALMTEKRLITVELQTLQGHHTELQQEVSELKSQHAQSQQEVSELKSQHAQSQQEVTELKSHHAQSLQEVSDFKSQHAQSQGEVDKLQMERTDMQKYIEKLCNDLEEMKQQREELQSETANKDDELKQNVQQKYTDLTEQLKMQKKEFIDEKTILESANVELKANIEQLQKEIEQTRVEIKTRDVEVETLRTRGQDYVQKISSLECAIQEREVTLTDVQKQLTLTEETLEEKQCQLNKMSADIAALQADNEGLAENVKKTQHEAETLRNEKDTLMAEMKALERREEEAVQKSEAQSTPPQEDWQQKINDLQKQLKGKEDRETKFKQLALRAKKEAADLKKHSEEMSKEILSPKKKKVPTATLR